MRIAIVGWGLEGQSAYKYFGPEHEYLIVNEAPAEDFPPEGDRVKIQFLKNSQGYGLRGSVKDLSYLEGIGAYDKIVYQPTAYFNLKKVFGDNPTFWDKATTVYDIFFENTPSKNIIGVTGTKGKGTTSTLIAKMLEAANKKVHLGGNIGTPILELLSDIKPGDWIVWELANFQLKPGSYSPHIAVCLVITPDHLDWHPSLGDYIEAKANIFKHQKSDDIAIYFADNEQSKKIANYSPGQKIPYYQKPGAFIKDGAIVIGEPETEILKTSELKLLGEHNWQNVCAAITAVWQVTQDVEAIRQVLTTFSGLEHRLEFVREVNGVKYYNDSFAAGPEATAAALASISGPKIMIIGGFERQLPLGELVKSLKHHSNEIRKIFIIGQSAVRVAEAFKQAGIEQFEVVDAKEMSAILSQVKQGAQPGDSVVLSPGFASFDMFKDFEVRGQEFKKAVNSL